MSIPEQTIADAIREVTIAIQSAISDGHRSRKIDADDLVEVLLSIADRLDPPVPVTASVPEHGCPECGAKSVSAVDNEFPGADKYVHCVACGTIFVTDG